MTFAVMALAGRRVGSVFFGTAALLAAACTPRGAQLPPEAQAALRGLAVGPGSPSTSLLRWHLPETCRLDYAARIDGAPVRFSLTGGAFGYWELNYPTRLAPAGGQSSMSLTPGDNGRQLLVPEVISPPIYESGRLIAKGIAKGVHAVGEEPAPWSRTGSGPGLHVFFPFLPQAPERKTLEGWFSVGGQTAALIRASSDDGLQGTYLVLATGRLLWARAVVHGQSDDFTEAKLVSACDGPTLKL